MTQYASLADVNLQVDAGSPEADPDQVDVQ
jgi:hypothetical protein